MLHVENVLHATQGCHPDVDGTVDADGDGIYTWGDNCPLSAHANQTDSDGDGIGDRCDCDFDNDGICADADEDDAWAWWACKNWFDPVLCAEFDTNSDGLMNGYDQLLYDAAKADGLPGPGVCSQSGREPAHKPPGDETAEVRGISSGIRRDFEEGLPVACDGRLDLDPRPSAGRTTPCELAS